MWNLYLLYPWVSSGKAGSRDWPGRGPALEHSGLGLRVSRRLVRAEHGRHSASSIPSRGSGFTLELPLGGTAAEADDPHPMWGGAG